MRRPFADTSREDGADLFAAINVTPFVDVMLVLLVVFMVVAPLMVRGLPLDLPTGTGRALGKPVAPTIVSVARDGTVAIGDARIPPGMLGPTLAAGPKPTADATAYVRADRQVPYGDVVAVIGALASHGYAHVSLLDRPLMQH